MHVVISTGITVLGVVFCNRMTATDHVADELLRSCTKLLYALCVYSDLTDYLNSPWRTCFAPRWSLRYSMRRLRSPVLYCGRPCLTKYVSPHMHEAWLQRTTHHLLKRFSPCLTIGYFRSNCLPFIPDRPSLNYSLRSRPNNKTLIAKTTQLNDQDFIFRSIYKDSYWLHFKHI